MVEGFTGELSTKEESASAGASSSSSLLGASNVNRGNGMVVWEVIRLRLSLMGDGDTGSPLSRLRARDTALVGTSGK